MSHVDSTLELEMMKGDKKTSLQWENHSQRLFLIRCFFAVKNWRLTLPQEKNGKGIFLETEMIFPICRE